MRTARCCSTSARQSFRCAPRASAACCRYGRRSATSCAGCVGAETKNGVLKLEVLRFGQTKPAKLEICGDRERRAPSAKRIARAGFQRLLGRMLENSSPGWKLQSLVSTSDLEHSFGPAYVRGILRRGSSADGGCGSRRRRDTAGRWTESLRPRCSGWNTAASATPTACTSPGRACSCRAAGRRWCGFGWHISITTLARWELQEFDERS